MVNVLWKETELKNKGGEEQTDRSVLLTTQAQGGFQAWAAAKGHI